ncbi:MAG TPA: lysophospholipid acyltransferase family protein [Paracoccaceae bacterium]|nr:lysophospholipid acyltransferase family protein [Paracoccaceae bacterium]HMO72215.1 lysophospholipid acyltransferase family protein [Paracoccaceae bacterium]
MSDHDTPGERPRFALRLRGVVLRGLIGGLLALPYRWRVPLCGWVLSRIVAPLAGYDRRIRENLALVLPGLPEAEVRRLIRMVPDNAGRTLIEIYSGTEFVARATRHPMRGEGLAALDAAHAAGRPVILVTGHFGNYDAARAALFARGFRVGSLYKPMSDASFNAHYVAAMESIGRPMFPRGRAGLAGMLRFLRDGGMLAMAIDQTMAHGAPLTFFGEAALTALSAADLALRHDAILVPIYGIRQPDGLSFVVEVEPPIPNGTPEAMTQALNDSLEALVRRHPDQWFWIHRRWKGRAGASA